MVVWYEEIKMTRSAKEKAKAQLSLGMNRNGAIIKGKRLTEDGVLQQEQALHAPTRLFVPASSRELHWRRCANIAKSGEPWTETDKPGLSLQRSS
jgi:hypothetical protein